MSMQSPLTASEAMSHERDLVQRVLVLFRQTVDGLLGGAAIPGALSVKLLEAHMNHEVLPAGRTFRMGHGRARIVLIGDRGREMEIGGYLKLSSRRDKPNEIGLLPAIILAIPSSTSRERRKTSKTPRGKPVFFLTQS